MTKRLARFCLIVLSISTAACYQAHWVVIYNHTSERMVVRHTSDGHVCEADPGQECGLQWIEALEITRGTKKARYRHPFDRPPLHSPEFAIQGPDGWPGFRTQLEEDGRLLLVPVKSACPIAPGIGGKTRDFPMMGIAP